MPRLKEWSWPPLRSPAPGRDRLKLNFRTSDQIRINQLMNWKLNQFKERAMIPALLAVDRKWLQISDHLSLTLSNYCTEALLTFACFPSMTATQELVVPRSMPITAPLMASDLQHTHFLHDWQKWTLNHRRTSGQLVGSKTHSWSSHVPVRLTVLLV